VHATPCLVNSSTSTQRGREGSSWMLSPSVTRSGCAGIVLDLPEGPAETTVGDSVGHVQPERTNQQIAGVRPVLMGDLVGNEGSNHPAPIAGNGYSREVTARPPRSRTCNRKTTLLGTAWGSYSALPLPTAATPASQDIAAHAHLDHLAPIGAPLALKGASRIVDLADRKAFEARLCPVAADVFMSQHCRAYSARNPVVSRYQYW
jgi:hypothetical protein